MQGVFQDCRYALRQLRKTPGFTVIAALLLALGIGTTTAVFSIVYATIINPYPFRDWQQMTWLAYLDQTGNPQCCLNLTGTQVQRLREAHSIEGILAYKQQDLVISSGDLREDVNTYYWTPNAISYLGVPLVLGRGFIPSDAPEGQEPQPVAILGYRFWQRHFGGDPGVLGKTIELSHNSYRIVGVLSANGWGNAEVLLPLKLTADPNTRLLTSIRLKPGVTVDAASAEIQPLFEDFTRETPVYFPLGFHVHLRPLSFGIRRDLGPSLYLLLGAVSVLLLIACLNVSVLLLGRGAKRQYELAVRAAIGAAHGRLVRQLLTESLILALLGEVLGIVLAYVLQRILIWELPAFLGIRAPSIYINIPVLLFSVGLVLIAVLTFGLMPALRSSRRQISQTMKLHTQNITGVRGRVSGNILISAQIALSLVLLVAAATTITAFFRLMHTNMGYDPKNAMALSIPVHQNSYTTWEARSSYFDRLKERIASTPDVITAAISTETIPPSKGWNTSLEIFGQNMLGNQEVNAGFVSQEYFDALQIPLVRGRLWSKTEIMTAAHMAVVNQTLARQYWPDGNAIGKQIRLPRLIPSPPTELSAPASDGWAEIIGIVGDTLNDGLNKPVKAAAFFPYSFHMPMTTQIVVRARKNPLGLLRLFRIQAQAVDADQQFAGEDTQTLEDFIADENAWQAEHLVAILFSAFALITLLLAAAGLYSVVSYSVAQRTSEFALRMALGAQRADVLLSVFLSTIRIVVVGLAAGMVLSLILKRVVAQWAYAIPSAPLIFFFMTPLLIGVATLAAFFPARRAMSVDPIKALRYE